MSITNTFWKMLLTNREQKFSNKPTFVFLLLESLLTNHEQKFVNLTQKSVRVSFFLI